MIALRCHYAGEGNSKRRIADTNKIQITLHYKAERDSSAGNVLIRDISSISKKTNQAGNSFGRRESVTWTKNN